MLRSLWTAATGMAAQQQTIDLISNNLANVNTTAFKSSRAEFQDLLYQTIRPAGITNNVGAQYPTPIEIGHGTKLSSTEKSFIEGSLVSTGNPLDLAIQGSGFFEIQLPNGQMAYTRDGSMNQDANGNIVTADGYYLQPPITIPQNATSVTVGSTGVVSVVMQGQTTSQNIGSIQLVNFTNPAGLESIGKNLYQETEASGQPQEGQPGYSGLGTIEAQYLESSNVSAVDEMVNLIAAQRAYELNAKAITTSDTMLADAINVQSTLTA